MPTKRCCGCSVCENITQLWDTGEEYTGSNIAGYSGDGNGPCAIDNHWTANGTDAYVFGIAPFGSGDPADRTRGSGCQDEILAITAVCSATLGGAAGSGEGKAVIEPGGPDGVETVFESQFVIPAGVNLNRIAFCGRFSADDYVKAGEWKVNGIDQTHIDHQTYFTDFTFPINIGACQDFAFTKETANLVHGVNTIAITVKNGNHASSPPDFGGPTYLQFEIYCVERVPCSQSSNGWTVAWIIDETGEGVPDYLDWTPNSPTGEDLCPCYCAGGGKPTSTPEYDGQTTEVPCAELHE